MCLIVWSLSVHISVHMAHVRGQIACMTTIFLFGSCARFLNLLHIFPCVCYQTKHAFYLISIADSIQRIHVNPSFEYPIWEDSLSIQLEPTNLAPKLSEVKSRCKKAEDSWWEFHCASVLAVIWLPWHLRLGQSFSLGMDYGNNTVLPSPWVSRGTPAVRMHC